MQSPSEIDDDKFQVATAAKLDRQRLMEMQNSIASDRHELTRAMSLGAAPRDMRIMEENYRRKGKQLFWIAHHLGAMKEAQRAASRKANNPRHEKRRQNFFEVFFHLCRRELEPQDFKELCEIAKKRSGEEPNGVVQDA